MLRGQLIPEDAANITAQLPDMDDLQREASRMSDQLISIYFSDTPEVPVAGVCIHDAVSTLKSAHFSVYEALAHKAWYNDPAPEIRLKQLWSQRYFADDAALRLYAVGEHLAKAITYLLRIDEATISAHPKVKGKSVMSLQAKVGVYLAAEHKTHPITQAVGALATSTSWKWTRDYRDEWVHNQPPLMEGFGIQFRREARWKSVDGASVPQKEMYISTGDPVEYTVDELVMNVLGALTDITDLATILHNYFVEEVEKRQVRDEARKWKAPTVYPAQEVPPSETTES